MVNGLKFTPATRPRSGEHGRTSETSQVFGRCMCSALAGSKGRSIRHPWRVGNLRARRAGRRRTASRWGGGLLPGAVRPAAGSGRRVGWRICVGRFEAFASGGCGLRHASHHQPGGGAKKCAGAGLMMGRPNQRACGGAQHHSARGVVGTRGGIIGPRRTLPIRCVSDRCPAAGAGITGAEIKAGGRGSVEGCFVTRSRTIGCAEEAARHESHAGAQRGVPTGKRMLVTVGDPADQSAKKRALNRLGMQPLRARRDESPAAQEKDNEIFHDPTAVRRPSSRFIRRGKLALSRPDANRGWVAQSPSPQVWHPGAGWRTPNWKTGCAG